VGLFSLLFSFNGRINRVQFWMGSIGIALFGFVASMMLLFSGGTSALSADTPQAAAAAFMGAIMWLFPLLLIGSWCGFALQIKRFHDRGRSGYWTMLPLAVAVPAMMTLFNAALSGASMAELEASMTPFVIASWVVNIGFFIDLGCLPGKEGPNRFGDPPGAPPSGAPYAPTPIPGAKGAPAAPAASSLLGAQSAMERAIAERARQPQAPVKATAPRPTATPTGGSPSFGRRATR